MRIGCPVIRQIIFRYVCGIDDRFCGEKVVGTIPLDLILIFGKFKGLCHVSFLKMRL